MSNRRKSFSTKDATPKVNPLEGVTFDVDGTEFRCEGRMSYLDTSDLARRVADLPTTDLDDLRKLDPQQAAAVIGSMSSTLLMSLGDAEYQRFRKFCHTNAIDDEVIVGVVQFINQAVQDAVEEDTDRPTGSSPRSPDGLAVTDELTSPPASPPAGEPPILQGKTPAPARVTRLGKAAGRTA